MEWKTVRNGGRVSISFSLVSNTGITTLLFGSHTSPKARGKAAQKSGLLCSHTVGKFPAFSGWYIKNS